MFPITLLVSFLPATMAALHCVHQPDSDQTNHTTFTFLPIDGSLLVSSFTKPDDQDWGDAYASVKFTSDGGDLDDIRVISPVDFSKKDEDKTSFTVEWDEITSGDDTGILVTFDAALRDNGTVPDIKYDIQIDGVLQETGVIVCTGEGSLDEDEWESARHEWDSVGSDIASRASEFWSDSESKGSEFISDAKSVGGEIATRADNWFQSIESKVSATLAKEGDSSGSESVSSATVGSASPSSSTSSVTSSSSSTSSGSGASIIEHCWALAAIAAIFGFLL